MLLADRVRDDLVAAVRATSPQGDVARAIDLIAAWDKTVSPESRGGTLFETWWRRYLGRGPGAPDSAYAALERCRADVDAPRAAIAAPRRRGFLVGGVGHDSTLWRLRRRLGRRAPCPARQRRCTRRWLRQ